MKISKISANMFGQNFQNLPQYVRIRSGICENFQILFRWPIRPPKSGILFGSANLASKNCNFTYLPVLCTNSGKKNHSPPIPSVVTILLRPFLPAATMALTAINIFGRFPRIALKIQIFLSSRVSVQL